MRNRPYEVCTNAHQFESLLMTPMAFGGLVKRQPAASMLQTLGAHIKATLGVTRNVQRGQGRHRPAADHQAETFLRKCDELFEPADDLPLDEHRGVIASSATWIHR